VEINASKLPDGTFFGSCRDIGPRKKLEEEIRQLAFRDPLTKLPNRRVMLDRVGSAKAQSQLAGVYSAVVFLDLDNFKPLNDTHGHEVGDLLLVEAARRLVGSVRSGDTVARFGGDEFVVLLDCLGEDRASSVQAAAAIGEKIRQEIGKPYELDGGHGGIPVVHHCTASVGVALFKGSEISVDDVLNAADQAMYRAKDAGRDRVHVAELDAQGEQKPLYI
jgi:diguanylate cyclase (GGDEF)-like protein